MNAAKFSFDAIGTDWQIDIKSEISEDDKKILSREIHDRIEIFDKDYSRFRPDSLVAKMASHIGEYELPHDAQPMLDLYEKLYDLSKGALTPLIGSVMVEAGYDASYSLMPKELHVPPEWNEAIEYKYPSIKIKKPALLDFGAIGKGYLVDIVSDILKEYGMNNFIVDAGGDLYHFNANGEEISVGLEHPENKDQAIGSVKLGNESICGSSGNRRTWGDFHHIIHPHALSSPRHISAAWTVAKKALLADGLATGLFLIESDILESEFDFEYAIMYSHHSVKVSKNFKGEIFNKQ